jgi:phosphatidylserine decarboxylase
MHTYYERVYEKEVSLNKGDTVGKFHLGSTIVLVFEAPKSFQWKVNAGEKISLGQRIGEF